MSAPAEPPPLDRQYTPELDAQHVQLYLNAQTAADPFWRVGLLQLSADIVRTQDCSVLARDEDGQLQNSSLAAWVTFCKPNLRGNSKDCYYFCRLSQRFKRLQHLWRDVLQRQQPADAWHATAAHEVCDMCSRR